jgi:hypothetical protein
VYAYYREAEFLVLPSVSENSPLVVIEALACGIPVLSTRLPGIEAIVHDGQNGVLVEAGDLASLTSGLRRLAGDRAFASKLKSRASAVESRSVLSWNAVVERLRAAYIRADRDARGRRETRRLGDVRAVDKALPERRTSIAPLRKDPVVPPVIASQACSAAVDGASEAGIHA